MSKDGIQAQLYLDFLGCAGSFAECTLIALRAFKDVAFGYVVNFCLGETHEKSI